MLALAGTASLAGGALAVVMWGDSTDRSPGESEAVMAAPAQAARNETVGVAEPPPKTVRTTRIVPPGPDTAPRQTAPVRGWDSALLTPQLMSPSEAAPPASAVPPPSQVPMPPRAPQAAAPGKKHKRKADSYDGRLTVAQIANIKRRLRLTAEQEEYWKPVEAALHSLAKKQERTGQNVTLTATEMQNLYFTAGPLVMSLRDDQKEEARNLARSMGLETVAELI
jgi:hypothetical protein